MPETPRNRRQHVKFNKTRATQQTHAAGSAGKPSKGQPVTPRIQVTRPAESALFNRGLVLSVLLIVALIAAGLHAVRQRPDPHFVKATKMLSDYERGRNEDARNYRNEVYERALSELNLVDPESVSFDEAHALRRDIEARREAFFANVRAAERQKSTRKVSDDRRRVELAAKQAYSRQHPRLEYPECEE